MSDYMTQNFGSHLRSSDGGHVPTNSISAEAVGIYFSAYWCPGCKTFTPKLASVYKNAQQNNKSFEIIFVSNDKNPSQFEEYYKTMPWLAIPFDSPLRNVLSSKYSIRAIPTLIIIKRDGQIISSNKQDVMSPNFVNMLPQSIDIQVKLEEQILLLMSDSEISTESKYLGLKTALNVISNIMKHPGDPKYMKINKSSSSFQTKLNNPYLLQILYLSGFKSVNESLICHYDNPTKLKEISSILSSTVESFNADE